MPGELSKFYIEKISLPNQNQLFRMSKVVKIRKGLNIRLEGEAEKIFSRADMAEAYAVKPTDFPGLTPKLTVQVGDTVKAGTVLFFDKYRPEVQFSSPVSGEVVAVNRGERRKILEVVVKPSATQEYEKFAVSEPSGMDRASVIDVLLKSGVWPYIRQRPYGIVANPADKPKAIFISGFDTAPLAPDLDFAIKGDEAAFQVGINALKRLTDGKVHLNLNADYPASVANTKGVEITQFSGPHPAGNVGIQIHHINPVNKGEVVWTVSLLDVVIIGRLFSQGIYDAAKNVALAGSEVLKPRYYKLIAGASLKSITSGNLKSNDASVRLISGNVLTGTRVLPEGFLGFYDNMVTAIPEGNYHQFLGWATPNLSKFSASRSLFSWLMPGKKYRLDTNYNGAERAYVMTEQYEKVLPMDIYPVHLIKAILAQDIDKMEQLGIYEVVEEDFALCEFVCTSKIEVQSIIRDGLDMMVREMN